MWKTFAEESRRQILLTWRRVATGERRTALELLKRGFLYWREPKFVKGRKPDFMTFGRGRMWVEVKELDPPTSQTAIGEAWNELTERFAKLSGKCSINAWIGPGFDSRIAKRATHLVTQELRAGLSLDRKLWISVPSGDLVAGVVQVDWLRHDGTPARLISLKTADGLYGCPPAAQPRDWIEDISVLDQGAMSRAPAFRILEEDRPARLLLLVDAPNSPRVLRGVSNSEVNEVLTIDRIRRKIDDANEQFKSGQAYCSLPALLVIYFDHLGGGDRQDVLLACLGDLTLSIDPTTNQLIDPRFGANGVLRPDRNTAVSAVSYCSRHYPTVTFVNPYALNPVNRGWLSGTVYHLDADGHIRTQ